MKPLSKRDNPLTEEEKAKKKNVPSFLTQFTIFNQQVVILSFKYLLPVTYTPRLTQEVNCDEVCVDDRPSIRTVFTATNRSGESHKATSNVL